MSGLTVIISDRVDMLFISNIKRPSCFAGILQCAVYAFHFINFALAALISVCTIV
jgi:hypothetical protein